LISKLRSVSILAIRLVRRLSGFQYAAATGVGRIERAEVLKWVNCHTERFWVRHAEQPDRGYGRLAWAEGSDRSRGRLAGEAAQVTGSLAGDTSPAALFDPYRRSLRQLVPAVHFVPQQTPSGRDGRREIRDFLTHLAVYGRVAASTQNQALNAIVFLYAQVLERELGSFGIIERAKRPDRLPVVLTRDEVKQILTALDGVPQLIGELLYGGGLRVMEAMRLRVKDVSGSFPRRG